MPTVTETGIDRKTLEAKMRAGGFHNLDEKTKDASRERGKNTSEQSSEKRKVKNQAEINRIQKENERIEKKREEISKAVSGALDLLTDKLSNKNLSEKERNRLYTIKRSTSEAYGKLKRGKYTVEAKQGDSVLGSREEPLPVEGLLTEVASKIEHVRERINEVSQIEQLKHKADANRLSEESKKKEWRKVLGQLPEGNLRKRIVALAEHWKFLDEADGTKKYSKEDMELQLGEACYKILKEHTEDQIGLLKKRQGERSREVQKLEKVLEILESSSENYFAHHYEKAYEELTFPERQKQDLYTNREVGLIEHDPLYREMLLEDYEAELPEGFDAMSPAAQDWELAVMALENRLVLNMPQLEKVPEPDYEEESEKALIKEEAEVSPSGVSLAGHAHAADESGEKKFGDAVGGHRLKNNGAEKFYDIENKAFSTAGPNLLNTNSSYDIENSVFVPERIEPREDSKKLFLIDISEIAKRMAWTKAEERMGKELKSGGMFSRVWKGLTENHKRIQYYEQAKKEIENDNNLMAAISGRVSGQSRPGTPSLSNEYIQLIDKIVAEYKGEVIDTQRELGESMNNNPEVQLRFSELLYRFRSDKWDGPEYAKLDQRSRVELFVKNNIAGYINETGSAKWTNDPARDKEAKGMLYANNFYEILQSVDQNYKEQIDAAVKDVIDKNPEANIEAVREAISKHVEGMQGLNLQLGLKDRDLVNNRPKGILTAYENAINFSENHKILGKIVSNPFVIGAAVTIGSRSVQRAIKWGIAGGAVALGATGFWVPVAAGAAAGGLYRAFKRGKDVKYDQAQELRYETLGGKGSKILGKEGSSKDLRYGSAVMSFKDALSQVAAIKDKIKNEIPISDEEKIQLANIFARLELERDFIRSTDGESPKVDLFNLSEDEGKRFGSTAAAKSDLRVALKDLAGNEKDLQGSIELIKGQILNTIEEVNKRQESFRRREMLKSGVSGAIIGLAGGVAAKYLADGVKSGLHFFGAEYIKLHNGVINYKHLVAGAGASPIEHFAELSHDRSPAEYLQDLKGHIAGGDVEKIHIHDWYDNNSTDQAVSEHLHNANELKLLINKDSVDNLRLRMPVEQGGSWVFHGNNYSGADIDKAFVEGHIKMILVPDGANPHDAIVLDVDPVSKEIIIPQGSNLRALFDETTGMPKGNGYLATGLETGVRPDGSKIYNSINSIRGNGQPIGLGKVVDRPAIDFIPNKPAVLTEVAQGYNSDTIPTVPLTRKVFSRPGERIPKETRSRIKIAGRGSKDIITTSPEVSEAELKKKNPEAFKKASVNKLINTFQWDLEKQDRVDAAVDLKVIKAYWDEEAKATKRAEEKAAEEAKKEAVKAAKKTKKGHTPAVQPKKELVVVHEEGPSTQEYLEEIEKLKNAVKDSEDRYKEIADIDKRIRQLESGSVEDISDDDIDDLSDRFEKLVGHKWNKKFNPNAHKKSEREKRRPFIKDEEIKSESPKSDGKNKAKAQSEKAASDQTDNIEDDGDLEEPAKTARSSREISEISASIAKFRKDYPVVKVYTKKAKEEGARFKNEEIFKKMEELMKMLSKRGAYKNGNEFRVNIMTKDNEARKTKNGIALPYDFKPSEVIDKLFPKTERSKASGGDQAKAA